MNAIELLRMQYQSLHGVLEATVNDVTATEAAWLPPGQANPLGATYVHVATGEDVLINATLRGAAPLMATTWAGRLGVDAPPPFGRGWSEWARSVKVDLPQVREYAQAVYAATDEYIASLSQADLTRSIDLTAMGLGMQTVGSMLNVIAANAAWHTGEISCLKGVQNKQGYPF